MAAAKYQAFPLAYERDREHTYQNECSMRKSAVVP